MSASGLPQPLHGAARAVSADRPAWRRALDARIDRWLTQPELYRFAIGNPITRWFTRRRAERLFGIMAGFVHSQVLLACVRLQLLEAVRQQPRTLDELAALAQVPAATLERLIRSAVSLELLEPRGSGHYGLGALGAPVATHAGLRDMVEHNAVLYADMTDPVRLMRAQSDAAMHALWPYTDASDASAVRSWSDAKVAQYSNLMASSQRFVIEELLASYDFSRHRCVLDVGGGKGGWIGALAQREPGLQLKLFDLPPVVDLARRHLQSLGVADRVQLHGGSFVHDAPPRGADLITLLRVAHDHPDEVVRALLVSIHAALPVGGTLLVAEPMAEPADRPAIGDPYYHFYLLAMGEGRLRTPVEIAALMQAAGFDAIEVLRNPLAMHARLLVGRKNHANDRDSAAQTKGKP